MQNYDDTKEIFYFLDSKIKEIKKVNEQLAKLSLKKDNLTKSIISAIGHNHEGQKIYTHGIWKVEVKTPVFYCLDKKLYESYENKIPENFNPVKKSISYLIDKKSCDKYIQESPDEVKNILIEILEKKPGKPSITIKENV